MSAAAMPLSARGVAGEATVGNSSLVDALRTNGGRVPRGQVFRATARMNAGLTGANTTMNPARESMEVGLGYRHAPEHPTRTALLESRRARHKDDLIQTRVLAQQDYVPIGARHTAREHEEYNMRRPDPNAKTLTKLKDQRKQDFTEYNMVNFNVPQPEIARYSDQAEPWWVLQRDHVPNPPSQSYKDPPKAVTLKPTEMAPYPPRMKSSATPRGYPSSLQEPEYYSEVDHSTHYRWSSEFIPMVLNSQVPRLFDGIKQASTFTTDLDPLQLQSSFDPIRGKASGSGAVNQLRNACDDHERSAVWRLYTRGGPALLKDMGSVGMGSIMPAAEGETSGDDPSHGGDKTTRRLDPAKLMAPGVPKKAPSGSDPSMKERLDRGLPGRPAAAHEERTELDHRGPSQLTHRGGAAVPPSATPVRMHGAISSSNSVSTGLAGGEPMVVRTSGFQWLDRHQQALADEMSIVQSLDHLSVMSAKNLGRETPSRLSRKDSGLVMSRMGSINV